MKNRIRILHVLWSGHYGGAERFVRDIISHSDKNTFNHSVMILGNSSWLSEQILQLGAECHCIGMKNGLSLRYVPAIRRIIRNTRPDIIHNHCRNYLFNILFMYCGVPGVYFEHGGDILGKNRWRDILFYKLFAGLYDLVLINSHAVKRQIETVTRFNPDTMKVLYIGIDPELYNKGREKAKENSILKQLKGKYIVGTVARLVEQKGIDDFLITASEIKMLDDDISFVVIGDGEKRYELEQLAKYLKVPVNFMGFRSDIHEILNIFDLFLITSKWEPFGITVLESMAAGVPVIGFSVDGMKEIIDAGGGGVLVEKRCHKTLAKVVVEILRDRKRYELLKDQGRSNIRLNFNITRCIKELEEHYLSLIISDNEYIIS